jgi:spore germination protein YaaH
MPPVFRRFRAFWRAVYALYVLALIALVTLPVSAVWVSVGPDALEKAVFAQGSGKGVNGYQPLLGISRYLYSIGIRPHKPPWVPSGVDYGNTAIPFQEQGERVCMAWQYRPKTLDAVPPGVNVLAPTWFYVESDGGTAVVNDLAHLLEGKMSSWTPDQYVSAAHEAGAKVWAVVACIGTPKLAKQVVTEEACRSEFLGRLAAWVRDYGLDGINFDFEDMDPRDAGLYNDLIAECKKALPPGIAVSSVVTVPLDNPSPTNWWQCYDRAGLGRAADYITVMAYDNMDMQPLASIGWVDEKIRSMLGMVPAEKLILGIPFYGIDFQARVPESSQLDAVPENPGASESFVDITPAVVTALLERGSYTSNRYGKFEVANWLEKGVWHEDLGMDRYAFTDTGGLLHLVYCDDGRSVRMKVDAIAFNRLAGAAVWRMEFGNDGLWNALAEELAKR